MEQTEEDRDLDEHRKAAQERVEPSDFCSLRVSTASFSRSFL